MSTLRGQAPAGEEVWTGRGELRDPGDRPDRPEQAAPERATDTPRGVPEPAGTGVGTVNRGKAQ
ncbi:hypothetical protein SAMN04487939_10623 [Lysobacter sp. yr284]|uniref:hypothetical protein n=1 Tax=Lysobacter sp. yr284 TaxID=1761791 RepID=UPI0008945EC5|nr:hypothetical protein [Lysobacter sp. yr284]SDY77624.1 hypothetical protein SAMN04487939_10623 [Lysobacter sp. yr284]